MNFKYFFYSFFIIFFSLSAKANIPSHQDISTITIDNIRGFESSLVIKITTNSIILPHGFCNDKKCPTDGQEIQYLGHHDIFKFVPEIYLTGSNYISPITYDGWAATKLEICFVDGRCHLLNYENSDNKEIILFDNKLNEILSGKSKYQFHSKIIPPMPKVIFDKKNLVSINLYQLIGYPFTEVLLYKISADSITQYPAKKCYLINGEIECKVRSEIIRYQDKYNIFKAFPTLFLSGSNFIDPREYGGGESNDFELFKIEGCFTDGHCNIWDFDVVNRYHDDEAKKFLNKIKQFFSDITKSKTNNKLIGKK